MKRKDFKKKEKEKMCFWKSGMDFNLKKIKMEIRFELI